MLDAVVDYLPSPTDIPAIKGIDEDENETEKNFILKNPFLPWLLKLQPIHLLVH